MGQLVPALYRQTDATERCRSGELLHGNVLPVVLIDKVYRHANDLSSRWTSKSSSSGLRVKRTRALTRVLRERRSSDARGAR